LLWLGIIFQRVVVRKSPGSFHNNEAGKSRGTALDSQYCRQATTFWNWELELEPELHRRVKLRNVLNHNRLVFITLMEDMYMMKLKLLAAAAALATLMAGPATAREVYHRAGHHYYHHYYNPGPIGAAAGIAGAAIGTAGAIATAPFRGAYGYDRGGYDPYYGRGW
jgi:hypothetical protein